MRIPRVHRRLVRRSIGLVIAMALVTVPAVVLASHQFPDVPNGHQFHTEIGAIADAGITAGFNDGGYHPSDAVTRQAMAAFMHRGFGRVGQVAHGLPITSSVSVLASESSSSFVPVRQITITVPGANNNFEPFQFVYVSGRVTFDDHMDSVHGCPCEFRAQIVDTADSVSQPPSGHYQTFDSSAPITMHYSLDVEGVFLATPGPHTYELQVQLSSRWDAANGASYDLEQSSSLTAMTFPFGPAGSDLP